MSQTSPGKKLYIKISGQIGVRLAVCAPGVGARGRAEVWRRLFLNTIFFLTGLWLQAQEGSNPGVPGPCFLASPIFPARLTMPAVAQARMAHFMHFYGCPQAGASAPSDGYRSPANGLGRFGRASL
jgi:hypothetical protein